MISLRFHADPFSEINVEMANGNRQFGVFVLVGIFCAVIDLGLMQLLNLRGINYVISATAGLTEHLNQFAAGARVLYPRETPYGATLQGSPLYLNWYAPVRQSQFNAISDAQTLAAFLYKEDVDFVITNSAEIEWTQSLSSDIGEKNVNSTHLLRTYMAEFGYVEAQSGPSILYRLSAEPILYRSAFDLEIFKRGAPITPNIYAHNRAWSYSLSQARNFGNH